MQIRPLFALPQGDLLIRSDQCGREQEDWILQAPLGLCSSERPLLSASYSAPQLGLLQPQLQKPRLLGRGCCKERAQPSICCLASALCNLTRTETLSPPHPPRAPLLLGLRLYSSQLSTVPFCGRLHSNLLSTISIQALLPWSLGPPRA